MVFTIHRLTYPAHLALYLLRSLEEVGDGANMVSTSTQALIKSLGEEKPQGLVS